MTKQLFCSASPYQENVLALPVTDLGIASAWYCQHFGMTEVDRSLGEVPVVVLERDFVRLGFAINGGDAAQDGAAIVVSDVSRVHEEFTQSGASPGKLKIEKRDGKSFKAFFVVAPDGLCFYFYQEVDESEVTGFWRSLKRRFSSGS